MPDRSGFSPAHHSNCKPEKLPLLMRAVRWSPYSGNPVSTVATLIATNKARIFMFSLPHKVRIILKMRRLHGESTLSLSIRKSAADGRVDCATCEHDPEISEAAKGCSMYMTRGLAVNCWQIFRRSPKRAVVKSLRACPSSSDLESKCPHVKSLPMLFVR